MTLICAGCSSDGDGAGTAVAGGATPKTSATPRETSSTPFEPYVSATTATDTDSASSPSTYNLEFVLSDSSSCTPKWSGTYAVGNSAAKSRIFALMDSGAAVQVSFGLATGTELARTCDSASAPAEAYGAALGAAGATQADFDLEGEALTDSASIGLRSKAIAILQKEHSDLKVSFTLPVTPNGLSDDGLTVLDSANTNAVMVPTVNIMAMNYGISYTGDMGDYALSSAQSTHDQLEHEYPHPESHQHLDLQVHDESASLNPATCSSPTNAPRETRP